MFQKIEYAVLPRDPRNQHNPVPPDQDRGLWQALKNNPVILKHLMWTFNAVYPIDLP